MTPAVVYVKKTGVEFRLHAYDHAPDARSFGAEAAEKLRVSPDRVLKTLVIRLDSRELAVSILPVSRHLDLKAAATALGARKAAMAEPEDAERATGYVTGGISPLGQKKRLKVLMDRSAFDHETVCVSAGRRGLQIEMAPRDLAAMISADIADIAR